MLGGWLLAPAMLVALAAGCGLLAERAARTRLPGALVPAAGLAALIVATAVPVVWDAGAELAVPLAAVLAAAGLALGRERLREIEWQPVAVGLGVYALFAAPSLLSGQGSIAGYVALDDSATWLAISDYVLEHGRDLAGLAPSSYQRTLETWLGSGYPVGAFLPLGVSARLTGTEPADAYAAVIAVYAAIAAVSLWGIARSAAVALLAVQASLFYGYLQLGGIKEAATVALLPAAALLALRGPLGLAALMAAGLLGVLGLPGLAWAAPVLALALFTQRSVVAAVPPLALAAVPLAATLEFARQATVATGGLRNADDLGNLVAPLSPLQAAGLWPVSDFRVDPDPRAVAVVLALACLALAAAVVIRGVRLREWTWPALLGVVLAGALPALIVGSPWVDAKVFAIVAPAVLAAAAAFPVRAVAVVLAAACAWSTLAVWRDVRIAPRERFDELQQVAERLGDRGPVVLLDFEAYGSRYFLRDADVEGATDLRVRRVARADGSLFTERNTAEVDEIAVAELEPFRAIVRRRTPVGSRPPASYALTFAGEDWELWERRGPMPLARLPLGSALAPVAVPSCEQVRALAEGARVLVAAPRTAPLVFEPGQPAVVPRRGRWRAWAGGSVRGHLRAELDGRGVGAERHELAHDGQWLRFGTARLERGEHALTLHDAGGWRPGRGGENQQSPLRPLALTLEEQRPLERVPAADHERLCSGAAYDWIEAYATMPAP